LLQRLLLLCGGVLVLVLVLAWYLAYAAALRRDHERHLADSADRLRMLSTRLLTAQEDERRSLSRDLHDDLGQVVTAVTLDLQRAAQAGDRERKDELIGRALRGAGCLLDHIHEISTRLRPTLLDDLGLEDAVRSLLSDYEQRTGIVTQAELSFEQTKVPPAVSENVYRILQEALTNVSKHAQAAEVLVALRVAGGQVTLTVRDAGVGLVPDALDGKRLGILGMRERAELLDGTFVLKAEPGQGTEVQVTIPIPKG
jgi:signal transduction histidine kinase